MNESPPTSAAVEAPPNDGASLSLDAALTTQMTRETRVSWSIDQNVIITTEDKLWRRIKEHLASVEDRKGWIAPVSIVATLLAALGTTTFKDVLGLDAPTWKAIFILAAIAAGLWSCVAVWRAFKSKSAEDLVDAIKSSGGTQAARLSIDSSGPQRKPSE